MAAGDDRNRPVLLAGVVEIGADRQRAVVRVRVELDVLMPAHRVIVSAVPFEVQFRMMEDHIRPHQIGDDIGDDVVRELPIDGMALVGLLETADHRPFGPVLRRQIEHIVGFGDAAAFLDEFVGHGAQPRQPFFRDQPLDEDVAVGEISLALRAVEHAPRMGKDFFRSHRRAPRFCASSPAAASGGPFNSTTFPSGSSI